MDVRKNVLLIISSFLLEVSTTAQECNLGKVFRTPKDMANVNLDHFELIERANFEDPTTTESPKTVENNKNIPKTYANAQVMLRFGGDDVNVKHKFCKNRFAGENGGNDHVHRQDHLPFYPPSHPICHPCYLHPYPPPIPFSFPNYYYFCPTTALPKILEEYIARHEPKATKKNTTSKKNNKIKKEKSDEKLCNFENHQKSPKAVDLNDDTLIEEIAQHIVENIRKRAENDVETCPRNDPEHIGNLLLKSLVPYVDKNDPNNQKLLITYPVGSSSVKLPNDDLNKDNNLVENTCSCQDCQCGLKKTSGKRFLNDMDDLLAQNTPYVSGSSCSTSSGYSTSISQENGEKPKVSYGGYSYDDSDAYYADPKKQIYYSGPETAKVVKGNNDFVNYVNYERPESVKYVAAPKYDEKTSTLPVKEVPVSPESQLYYSSPASANVIKSINGDDESYFKIVPKYETLPNYDATPKYDAKPSRVPANEVPESPKTQLYYSGSPSANAVKYKNDLNDESYFKIVPKYDTVPKYDEKLGTASANEVPESSKTQLYYSGSPSANAVKYNNDFNDETYFKIVPKYETLPNYDATPKYDAKPSRAPANEVLEGPKTHLYYSGSPSANAVKYKNDLNDESYFKIVPKYDTAPKYDEKLGTASANEVPESPKTQLYYSGSPSANGVKYKNDLNDESYFKIVPKYDTAPKYDEKLGTASANEVPESPKTQLYYSGSPSANGVKYKNDLNDESYFKIVPKYDTAPKYDTVPKYDEKLGTASANEVPESPKTQLYYSGSPSANAVKYKNDLNDESYFKIVPNYDAKPSTPIAKEVPDRPLIIPSNEIEVLRLFLSRNGQPEGDKSRDTCQAKSNPFYERIENNFSPTYVNENRQLNDW